MSLFDDEMTNFAIEQAKAMDKYIIDFFGSEERAREEVKWYVLEESPMEFTEGKYDDNNNIRYEATTSYRLRLKTPEELAAEEQIDELEGFEPTKWWAAIADDDTILAETSNPEDFKSLGLYNKPGVMITRWYIKKADADYMSVKEDPFKEQQ